MKYIWPVTNPLISAKSETIVMARDIELKVGNFLVLFRVSFMIFNYQANESAKLIIHSRYRE